MRRRARSGQHAPWKAILVFGAIGSFLILSILAFMLTSSGPWVEERPAPTADQVGSGRDAVLQLRASRASPQGSQIDFGPAQLDGLSALASHGFRPDRLQLEVNAGMLGVTGSHRLPGGRWLNVGITARGSGAGFPRSHLSVGSLTLSPMLSRVAFNIGRILLRLRGVDVPPLDALVHRFAVTNDRATATISLPRKSGFIDRMAGLEAAPIDSALVVRIYCGLAARQTAQPLLEFTGQVRRAFSMMNPNVRQDDYNRAAFIALGMLLVDERVGDLASSARSDSAQCRIRPVTTRIYGRADWPQHWTLSAALGASAGTQLAEAMGEWKELADSLSKQSHFAIGDPTGFSFPDLAADRSGFRVARKAVDAHDATAIAAQLALVTPEQLLPRSITQQDDGLSNADFTLRYGGLNDPRFLMRVKEIDRVLDREGVR